MTIEPGTRMPRLRTDLEVKPASSSDASILEVVDPVRGRKFMLHDFELSIARMLDGQRTAQEVVDASVQLGMSLSVESLGQFLHKLESYGLVSEAVPLHGGPTWAPRQEWDEETRNLFQAAMRQSRTDQFPEARKSLVELLEKTPGTPEAVELLARVDRAIEAGGRPAGTRAFSDVFLDVERSWFQAADAPSLAASLHETATANQASDRVKTMRLAIGAVVLVVSVAAVLIAAPWRHVVTAPAVLRASRSLPVTLPKAGKLASVAVIEGQAVAPGALLATYDTGDAKQRQQTAEAQLAAAETRLKRYTDNPKAARAKAALDAAESSLKRAQLEFEAAQAAPRAKRARLLPKAQKKLNAARGAEAKARRTYAASVDTSKAEAIRAEIDRARRDRDSAMAEGEALTVKAPGEGIVVGLAAKPGPVSAGATLLTLEDTRTLIATFNVGGDDARRIKSGQAVTLTFAGAPYAAVVRQITSSGVEAAVSNGAGTLKTGSKGVARIDL